MSNNGDVIFALSSGQGKAGVAVIRISGQNLQSAKCKGQMEPRKAMLVDWFGIDNLLMLWFPAPNSFTGEDVVELHCHGGQAVIQAIFDKLRSFGYRMAERGEFSRRAFQNGKMDLVEVDGMRALIDAKTERQRQRALKALTGKDTGILENWRRQMTELAALSAARMDYDSDDLPKNINEQILGKTQNLRDEIGEALKSNRTKILESGFNVVLAGDVNVGKSSLFNRLLGESRAIVSEIPGTTRDVISAQLDIDGFLVNLMDTAGIRETKDEIEKVGVEKAVAEMDGADLILRVVEKEERGKRKEEIIVVNKIDALDAGFHRYDGVAYVSAMTGEGIKELLDAIKVKIKDAIGDIDSDLSVGERARGYLERAVSELDRVPDALPELQAEHIMNAANEIGQILGNIGAEEIYDSVFGQLCLGK